MEDGIAFREYTRQRFFEIWQKVCDEEELEGEEAIIGTAMLEHEEYHNTWEMADVLADYENDPETDVNPFLHMTMHAIVENQIALDTPKEVRTTLRKLEARGDCSHDAVHKIGTALTEEISKTLKYKKGFDENRYVNNLKRLTY